MKKHLAIGKIVIFCFLLSEMPTLSYSQDKALGTVKIASPNAASLGKFVDIPVNYYSGIPSIGIPLYTVKSGSLELPIGLSYHASGLKLHEQASWVGAGWALNAGGVITRTVRGAPDEKRCNSLNQVYGHLSDSGFLNYMFKNDDGTPRTQTVTGEEFYTGKYDGEPDLFFFNFGGYSGRFYFNDDRTPVIAPEQDIKIEYIYIGGTWSGGPGPYTGLGRSIDGFILTTPDGVKYYFGMTGTTPVSPYVDPIEVTSPYTLNNGPTYSRSISSWYLNKVVSPDGQFSIELKYTRDSYAYFVASASNPISATFSGDYNTYDLVKNLIDGVKLSQISYANGKVDFVPGAMREDLCNWTQGGTLTINDATNQNSPVLGSIQISDNQSNGFCKKFTFTYSYFTDNTTSLPSFLSGMTINSDKKRLRLDYLQEANCSGSVSIPPYHFEYFSEAVPRTVSFGMDHWGFINGAANTDLLPSLTINGTPSITTSVNRNSVWPAMRGGTLSKITYPTGGSTTYEYEANTFTVNNVDQVVGGLRVKTITQSDGIDPLKNVITSFGYLDATGKSSAILYSKPVYIQKIRNDIKKRNQEFSFTSLDGCFPTSSPIYSRNTIRPMETTQGYHLGYGEVKVSKVNNGYSIFRYYGLNPWEVDHTCVAVTNLNNPSTCDPLIPNHPAAPLPNDFKRGRMKFEGQYNQAGQVLAEKEYYFTYQDNPVTVPGYIFVAFQNSGSTAVLGTFYELKTGKLISSSITERSYQPSIGAVETQTETLYESVYHHQPTKITTTNSLSQAIEKRIKYASDFVPSSISTITDCSYQNYASVLSSFPASYQSALNSCDPNEGLARSLCVGTVWYNYLKDVSNARKTYVSCRSTNYVAANSTYNTVHKSARTNADPLLKPILWLQDNYMIVPIEIMTWKGGKLVDATFNLYSNNRDDQYGIYPYKTQTINLASPSVTFTSSSISTNNQSITRDSRYTDIGTYAFYKGNLINHLSTTGVPTSYQWAYANHFPVVAVTNASNSVIETAQIQNTSASSGSFSMGPSNGYYSSQITFEHVQAGPISVNMPGVPPGAKVSLGFSLSGPSYQSGNLCISGAGGPSCNSTPSTITYTNMPVGTYTLSYTASTSFQSYTFTYSIGYSFSSKVIVTSGTREFFYEGFEESSDGGVVTGAAHTGAKYSSSNYSVNYTLPNGRNYLLQWWNLVNGIWNFNQQAYTGSITLTGPVDDVRIFPSDAAMTSFTIKPLTGITSETLTNGRTNFYFYDVFNRLNYVKDNESNVVRKVCYTYTGQAGDCPGEILTTYYSVIKTGIYTRNNCSPGYSGSTVTYTVPAGTYTSSTSQADADNLAQNDVNTNGQAYANANGTCIANVSIIGSNSKSKNFTVTFNNVSTGTNYSFTLNAYASNVTLGQVPVGTYNVNFSPQGSPILATFKVNTYTQSGVYYGAFSNIPVSSQTTVIVN